MTCIVTAGICPKPEHTYGEPHYCTREDWHQGPHRCRCCALEFNAAGIYTAEVSAREVVANPVPAQGLPSDGKLT